jgi:hypothetical protein
MFGNGAGTEPGPQAEPERLDDRAPEVLLMEHAISQQLAEYPQWHLPAHHLELACWLNEQIDEGASRVIDDPAAFGQSWTAERGRAVFEGPGASLGLPGYPDFDLSLISAPACQGQTLVFYVQRYISRLPLKVSVSLLPPHLPALYEPVPQPIEARSLNDWIRA